MRGPLRNLRRLSSSNSDQSIGASGNGVAKLFPFSIPFSKMSKMLASFNKFRLLRLSCDVGKWKHSMKLAVPEFNKNFMLPRSDEEFASWPILVDDSPTRKSYQYYSIKDHMVRMRILSSLRGTPFACSLEYSHSILFCRQVLQGLRPSHPSFIDVHCPKISTGDLLHGLVDLPSRTHGFSCRLSLPPVFGDFPVVNIQDSDLLSYHCFDSQLCILGDEAGTLLPSGKRFIAKDARVWLHSRICTWC